MARSKVARAQSRSKNEGKAARAPAEVRDMLAQAERKRTEAEEAEGGSFVDRIVAGVLAPVNRRHTMLAAELRAVSDSLGEALGDIIEAHTQEDGQAFSEALRRVNSARVILQGEACKLAAVQS